MAPCVGPSWGQHQGRNGPQQKGAQVPPSCGYRLSSPCECTQGRHRHGTRPHEALNGEIPGSPGLGGGGGPHAPFKTFSELGPPGSPAQKPPCTQGQVPNHREPAACGARFGCLDPQTGGGKPWGPPKVAKHNMFCGPAMLPCTQPPRPACAPQACQGMATLTWAAKSQTNTPLGRKPFGWQFCKDPGQIY